jgi:hypothetical protein
MHKEFGVPDLGIVLVQLVGFAFTVHPWSLGLYTTLNRFVRTSTAVAEEVRVLE